MKKWLLIISATVICVAAAFLYFFSLTPKGDTITSREQQRKHIEHRNFKRE